MLRSILMCAGGVLLTSAYPEHLLQLAEELARPPQAYAGLGRRMDWAQILGMVGFGQDGAGTSVDELERDNMG